MPQLHPLKKKKNTIINKHVSGKAYLNGSSPKRQFARRRKKGEKKPSMFISFNRKPLTEKSTPSTPQEMAAFMGNVDLIY